MEKTPVRRRTQLSRSLRRTQTSAEDLLWRELRNRRLDGWKFRRQMPIAGHIVDFACESARVTIELDGVQHTEQSDEDVERTAKITASGYLELRFTNDDIRGRPHWVIEEIRRALDTAKTQPMRSSLLRID